MTSFQTAGQALLFLTFFPDLMPYCRRNLPSPHGPRPQREQVGALGHTRPPYAFFSPGWGALVSSPQLLSPTTLLFSSVDASLGWVPFLSLRPRERRGRARAAALVALFFSCPPRSNLSTRILHGLPPLAVLVDASAPSDSPSLVDTPSLPGP